MALSTFDDKLNESSDAELAEALGKTGTLWDDLKNCVRSRLGSLSTECEFNSKNAGWSLQLKHQGRTILYMTPCGAIFLHRSLLERRQ